MPSRRQFLTKATALSAVAWLRPNTLWADGDATEESAVELVTPGADRVVGRGLKFLAGQQMDDGAFGSRGYSRNVAVCGLCGLAFMAGGSTPGRGPYGEHVKRTLNFILSCVQPSGFINTPGASSHGPMYGHGFATLFLSQAYGMSRKPELREALAKAIKLIVSTQNRDGGWRYHPQPRDADVSMTVCQVMALRAARNVGLYVPNETIDRCIEYVKKSQNADGGFRYMIIEGGDSAFPRSAAGLVALYSAGIYDGPEITRGLEYLTKFLPGRKQFGREGHYFYGHYYAVQAMWHAGGDDWQRWYPAIRDELITSQQPQGHWMDSICREYATAMACIILQLPNNLLPIFQR
ncbi:MAG: prenyltransferase/squalene oxidase repeat-containing protein [Pirellulales bacterium]